MVIDLRGFESLNVYYSPTDIFLVFGTTVESCKPAGYPAPDPTRSRVRVKFAGSVRVSGMEKKSGSGPGTIVYPDPNR